MNYFFRSIDNIHNKYVIINSKRETNKRSHSERDRANQLGDKTMTKLSFYTELELIECKNIVHALKKAKTFVNFRKKQPLSTQQLLLIANNNQLLTIGTDGTKYAIAKCNFPTTENFKIVVALHKQNGKEIGLCKFLEILEKQNKLSEFSYTLDHPHQGTTQLVCKAEDSIFRFDTLPTDIFYASPELQTIIDDFRGDSNGYDVVDSYGIEQIDNDLTNTYGDVVNQKSINHICFDAKFEYFILKDCVYRSHRSNTIDIDTNHRGASSCGSCESILSFDETSVNSGTIDGYPSELINYLKDNFNQSQPIVEAVAEPIVEAVAESIVDCVFLAGIGRVPFLPAIALKTGNFIAFDDLYYQITFVKKANFLNCDRNLILKLKAIGTGKNSQILVRDSDLLPAWGIDMDQDIHSVNTATEITENDLDVIDTDVVDAPIKIVSPKKPQSINSDRANVGAKGETRDKLIELVINGATLDQIMTTLNWSRKTASNHMTYIKWWGYDLKKEGNLYKLTSSPA